MCVYFVRNRKRAYVHVMYMFYSAFVWLSISNIFFFIRCFYLTKIYLYFTYYCIKHFTVTYKYTF